MKSENSLKSMELDNNEIESTEIYKQFDISKNRITYLYSKRVLDVFVSGLGLIFLSPVFLIVAILMKIKEPTGTILFGHTRNGQNGKKFKMYKFRSMCLNAEEILMADPVLYEKFVANGYKLGEGEDPRITKVGAFLRKTSLDELPQLVNVLFGSMSLVGPRPIPDNEIKEYGLRKNKFLSVKPGITGWWQVSGRSNIGYPERCDLELEYIDKMSLGMDIKILVLTFVAVLKKEGAV